MNFIAALFGTFLIIATLCTCLSKKENWLYCKECPSCSFGSVIAFLFITALLVTILIAGLLTMFMSFYSLDYSSEHGDSPNYSRATVAAFFSCCAAGCLLMGFCIGGPILCCMSCNNKRDIVRITSVVMCVWALLVGGTLVSGGLMMKVGQSFASEETLDPDERLNRGPISAMGYFIGTLNFMVLFIAIPLFITGILFWNSKQPSEDVELKGAMAYIFGVKRVTTYTIEKKPSVSQIEDCK